MQEIINSLPEFMWNNIFTTINALVCGLIVAIFTSTFLKKKEERTRIAGVIVEKRINSEQEVLHYLEHELFKEELNIENSSKYDLNISKLLQEYGLPDPYDGHIQYARVFKKKEDFEKFFHGFEEQITRHKLWLDTKVKTHLVFMQLYFSVFNGIPLMVKRIPLPEGKELTDEEFDTVCDKVRFLLGASCDGEINALMSELDEKIVDSIYRLELKRPRKSMMRSNMYNVDIRKCMRRLYKKTILGVGQRNIDALIKGLVYAKKGLDLSNMSNDEYDEFLKSATPDVYAEANENMSELKDFVEKLAKENGAKVIHKKDIDKYPDMYSISLKEVLEGKEPMKVKDRHRNSKK